jgi:hypothetical protein
MGEMLGIRLVFLLEVFNGVLFMRGERCDLLK